jgi:hypothetical protein
MHLLPASGATLLGTDQGLEVEPLQRVFVVVALKNDVAPTAAIAAVGATMFDARFTPETAAAVAAFASANLNSHLIDKLAELHRGGVRCAVYAPAKTGTMLTTRPSLRNLTVPAARANSVKSRP